MEGQWIKAKLVTDNIKSYEVDALIDPLEGVPLKFETPLGPLSGRFNIYTIAAMITLWDEEFSPNGTVDMEKFLGRELMFFVENSKVKKIRRVPC